MISVPRRFYPRLLTAGIVLAIFLRVLMISADPPVPVPEDAAFRTDQGWYNHNALNRIQTGKWLMPAERNTMVHTPLFSYLQYLSFKWCGVHLWVSRLPAILLSLLTIAGSALVIYRTAGAAAGTGCALLLGMNYLYTMYSRSALVEPHIAFFLAAAFFVWAKGAGRKPYLTAVASALLLLAAVLCKANAAFFLLFIGLDVPAGVLLDGDRRKPLIRAALFMAVFFAAYTAWKWWWTASLRDFEMFTDAQLVRMYFRAPSLMVRLREYLVTAMLWVYYLGVRMPVITALAGMGILAAGLRLLKRDRAFFRNHRFFISCCLMVTAHLAMFTGTRAIRPRYQVLIFVPVVFIAVEVLLRGWRMIRQNGTARWITAGVPGLALAGVFLFKLASPRTAAPGYLVLAAAAAAGGVSILLLTVRSEESWRRRSLIVLGGAIMFQLIPLGVYFVNPSYSTVECGREVRQVLEENGDRDAYVKGYLAPTLAMEGNFRSVTGLARRRVDAMYRQYRPAYLLTYTDHPSGRLLPAVTVPHREVKKLKKLDYRVVNGEGSEYMDKPLFLYRIEYGNKEPDTTSVSAIKKDGI